MTYTKPEIVVIGAAVHVVKGDPKNGGTVDNMGAPGTSNHNDGISAYQADE